jgi:hypothetical protein
MAERIASGRYSFSSSFRSRSALLDRGQLLAVIVDDVVWVEPGRPGFGAQDPRAQGVERADGQPFQPVLTGTDSPTRR